MDLKTQLQLDTLTHLSPRQQQMAGIWTSLQDTLNAGKFGDEMDAFFTEDFSYGNPSRPDLGSYASWKTSPMELYRRLPPSHYTTLDVAGRGEDQIWVHCHHTGKHTGGPYMGQAPSGTEFVVEWFSIVSFVGDKIVRIFSIADVLSMLIQLGVLDKSALPVDPYKE